MVSKKSTIVPAQVKPLQKNPTGLLGSKKPSFFNPPSSVKPINTHTRKKSIEKTNTSQSFVPGSKIPQSTKNQNQQNSKLAKDLNDFEKEKYGNRCP